MNAASSIHVSNLSITVTEEDLRVLFSAHGTVQSVSLPTDLTTGQRRGFGFINMPEPYAKEAIAALDGQTLQGRSLRVSPAQAHRRQGGGPFRR
jgi:RNA recognition motif-containing protein